MRIVSPDILDPFDIGPTEKNKVDPNTSEPRVPGALGTLECEFAQEP